MYSPFVIGGGIKTDNILPNGNNQLSSGAKSKWLGADILQFQLATNVTTDKTYCIAGYIPLEDQEVFSNIPFAKVPLPILTK